MQWANVLYLMWLSYQSWSGDKGLGCASVHGLVSVNLLPPLIPQCKATLYGLKQ